MQSGICSKHYSEDRCMVHFLFVSFQNNVSADGKVSCREMFGSFNIEVPVFLVPCMCYYVTGRMSMEECSGHYNTADEITTPVTQPCVAKSQQNGELERTAARVHKLVSLILSYFTATTDYPSYCLL
jgi:hypothetical protein